MYEAWAKNKMMLNSSVHGHEGMKGKSGFNQTRNRKKNRDT